MSHLWKVGLLAGLLALSGPDNAGGPAPTPAGDIPEENSWTVVGPFDTGTPFLLLSEGAGACLGEAISSHADEEPALTSVNVKGACNETNVVAALVGYDTVVHDARKTSLRPRQILAMVNAAKRKDASAGGIEERTRVCHELFGDEKPVEDCEAYLDAKKKVVVVSASRGCDGDPCDGDALVVTEEGLQLSGLSPFVAIAWDGRRKHVYSDTQGYRCSKDSADESGYLFCSSRYIFMTRIDVTTGAEEPWVDCFSPSLSPQGRWVYCRDYEGNVWRFADGTRARVLVWKNDQPDAGVYITPHIYFYPGPVGFEQGRLRFSVYEAPQERERKYDCPLPTALGEPVPSRRCRVSIRNFGP